MKIIHVPDRTGRSRSTSVCLDSSSNVSKTSSSWRPESISSSWRAPSDFFFSSSSAASCASFFLRFLSFPLVLTSLAPRPPPPPPLFSLSASLDFVLGVSSSSRMIVTFLEGFQFRWLKIKSIYPTFPISITLFSNRLKSNSPYPFSLLSYNLLQHCVFSLIPQH